MIDFLIYGEDMNKVVCSSIKNYFSCNSIYSPLLSFSKPKQTKQQGQLN